MAATNQLYTCPEGEHRFSRSGVCKVCGAYNEETQREVNAIRAVVKQTVEEQTRYDVKVEVFVSADTNYKIGITTDHIPNLLAITEELEKELRWVAYKIEVIQLVPKTSKDHLHFKVKVWI